jgi:hypothetical protein
MNTAPATAELQKLRAKTDRQLAVLVRREVKRGQALVNQARTCDAKRSYETAETLLAMTELPVADRERLQQELDLLRESLGQRTMSAA